MVMEDTCRCISINCPRYEECARGNGYEHSAGIYTASNLIEECNQNNNYKSFIQGEKYD